MPYKHGASPGIIFEPYSHHVRITSASWSHRVRIMSAKTPEALFLYIEDAYLNASCSELLLFCLEDAFGLHHAQDCSSFPCQHDAFSKQKKKVTFSRTMPFLVSGT